MVKLFDTHTHLNADHFVGKEAEYIERAKAADVHYMKVVGFDEVTIKRALNLIETYPQLIAAVGWHPTEADTYTASVERQLQQWLDHDKVKVLGEIGLDYYWETAPHDVQANVFRRQIAIAKEQGLPITIHNREATEDVYRILKQEGLPQAGGIMHSFGGTAEEAMRFVDLGMHISFSGVLTFKKSEQVREAARIVPVERLLIETDAPYLAPVPHRGKQNEPAFVRYVAELLAKERELSLEELAHLTTRNACDLFRWQPEEGI